MAEPKILDTDIARARQEFEDYLESYEAEEGEAEDDPKWWLGFIFWVQARFREDAETLSNELIEGDIDLDEWHIAMQERVKTLHIVCAVAGVMGDWDAINRVAIEDRVQEQYEYLEGFREDIEEKQEEDEELTSWVTARAGSYAGSLLATYYIIRTEEERERGQNEVLWIVTSGNPCSVCPELQAIGWMSMDAFDDLGHIPGDGKRPCHSN